jgi:hypothetical protein
MDYLIIAGLMLVVAFWAQLDARKYRRRLNALRNNCFVTSERGHRIRYVNASPEVRARAETN